jgi:hypothetical protein
VHLWLQFQTVLLFLRLLSEQDFFLKGNEWFPWITTENVADLRRFSRSAKISGRVNYFNI